MPTHKWSDVKARSLTPEELEQVRAEAKDGVAWTRAELGRTLRRARETAGLSLAELAGKLGDREERIARFEAGEASPSERYVERVLKVCGLPPNWPAE